MADHTSKPASGFDRLVISQLVTALVGAGMPLGMNAQTTTLYGCVTRSGEDGGGKLRLVSATEACKRNETRIQWGGGSGSTGPQGPQGPAGPVGPAGVQGPTGAAGAQGPTGAQGAQGATGAQGPQGPAGADGASGPAGAQGAQGAMGGVGPQGPAGAAGPLGVPGLPGLPGLAGPSGPQGTTGLPGLAGPTGPQGPATVGAQGPTGARGPTGPAGSLGPTGGITGLVTCNVTGQTINPTTLVYVPGRAFTAVVQSLPGGTTGTFTIDKVPPGSYTLAVENNGARVGTPTAVVTVGSTSAFAGSLNACTAAPPPTGPCGVCPDEKPICNTVTSKCVQCLTDVHCNWNIEEPICMDFTCTTGGL